MLNNAGNKIVLWSKILLYVGISLSVGMGLLIMLRGSQANTLRFSMYHTSYLYQTGMMTGGRAIAAGFLVMIFGSLGSWLTALLLRAFGDLTADTKAIRERLEETTAMKAEEAEEVKPEAPVRKRTRKPAASKAETSEKTDAE